MANYECRPVSSRGTVGGSFSDQHTFEDWSWPLEKVSILVKRQPAIISARTAGEDGYGDSMLLAEGEHVISFSPGTIEGIRIKARWSDGSTEYQICGYPD